MAEMLIDPIYEKFTKSVIRAIGSTDFYDFFMDTLSRANNEIQFSNRRMKNAWKVLNMLLTILVILSVKMS